ncbi:MAG: hypothetical protein KC646_03730 [Candidatus Cloacimonetes bacterium]|nr:hypothetical protein [Candidatus Cloacimonadota bacterium]
MRKIILVSAFCASISVTCSQKSSFAKQLIQQGQYKCEKIEIIQKNDEGYPIVLQSKPWSEVQFSFDPKPNLSVKVDYKLDGQTKSQIFFVKDTKESLLKRTATFGVGHTREYAGGGGFGYSDDVNYEFINAEIKLTRNIFNNGVKQISMKNEGSAGLATQVFHSKFQFKCTIHNDVTKIKKAGFDALYKKEK